MTYPSPDFYDRHERHSPDYDWDDPSFELDIPTFDDPVPQRYLQGSRLSQPVAEDPEYDQDYDDYQSNQTRRDGGFGEWIQDRSTVSRVTKVAKVAGGVVVGAALLNTGYDWANWANVPGTFIDFHNPLHALDAPVHVFQYLWNKFM